MGKLEGLEQQIGARLMLPKGPFVPSMLFGYPPYTLHALSTSQDL